MRALMEAMETRTLLSVLPMPDLSSITHATLAGSSSNDDNNINYSSPQIAADPLNNQKLVTVAVQNKPDSNLTQQVFVVARYSTNGGNTWTTLTIPGNLVDPTTTSNPRTVYTQATDPTVAFDRNEAVYVVYSEHSDDNAEGQIVMQKFDFSGTTPSTVSALRNKSLYQWAGSEADVAINPYMAVDNNVPSFTDPDTGDVQTDPFVNDIYVVWGTVTDKPTGAGNNFNQNNIQIIGSNDGGTSFSTPRYVNDTPFSGPQHDTHPHIVISQGTTRVNPQTLAPVVSPGQVTVVWDDFGSAASATPKFDEIKTDVIQDGVSAHIFTGTPGTITDTAQNKGVNNFPVTVSITNPAFVLTDLNVSLSITDATMGDLSIVLIAPNNTKITLVGNPGDGTGLGITGANLGVFSVGNPPPGNLNAPTVFDSDAARGIRQGAAPFTSDYQPEDGTNGLDVFNGLNAAALNGTWTVQVTDFNTNNAGNLNFLSLNFTGGLTSTADVVAAASVIRFGNTIGFPAVPAGTIYANPVIASDNTLGSFSPYQGRLYIAYVDRENTDANGNPTTNTDIFLTYSDDGGQTWTPQLVSNYLGQSNLVNAVNDDNGALDGFSGAGFRAGRTQFQPAMTVDPNTGTLVMTWYDARNDPANARIANYIGMSIDGGQSFSQQTYVNPPNVVTDAITGIQHFRGPIADNQSSVNGIADNTFSYGNQHGIVAAGGHVVSVWSGNESGGLHGNEHLRILGSVLNIANGPRIVSSTEGVVSQAGDTINPAAADGSPQVLGFRVKFDRPIDPATFTPAAITVMYRDANTSGTAPGTIVRVGSVTLVDNPFPVGPAGIDDTSEYFVAFETPQTGTGTYSFVINPTMSDRIRTLNGGLSTGNTVAYNAAGNQINKPIPAFGTGGTGISFFDNTTSTITINNAGTDLVNNITVTLNLTHANDGDLTITLTSPSGTVITLSDQNGSFGQNYTSTVFDDAATTSIVAGLPPFTGPFAPESPLAALIGEVINGTWTLTVTDNVTGDTGQLVGWSMSIQHSVVGPASGNLLDQNSSGRGGQVAVPGTTLGDVYAVPNPTLQGSLQTTPITQVVVTPGTNLDITSNGDANFDPAIAVDPTNPMRVFMAATHQSGGLADGLAVAFSINGGTSWTTRVIADGSDPLPTADVGEPSVAWDQFGNLFLTYIHTNVASNEAFVLMSTDHGQTFTVIGGPVAANDRPNLAVGPSTQLGVGSLWLTVHNPNELDIYSTAVAGLGTVAPFPLVPVVVAGASDVDFASGAVSSNGDFMVVYQTVPLNNGPAQILQTTISALGNISTSAVANTNVGASYSISAQPNGIDAEPQLAWDRSGGAQNGRAYLVYTNVSTIGSEDTDIFLVYSDDLGSTWSSPVKVNRDGTSNSQFMPRVAVDQTNGDVAVTWFDARNAGSNNDTVQLYGAVSTDGGATFVGAALSSNVQLGKGAVDGSLTTSGSLGDYNGLAFNAGTLYPVWGDNSVTGADTEIFTAVSSAAMATINAGYVTPQFDTGSLPLIVPGPHIIGTSQSVSSSSTQNNLPIPTSGTGGSGVTANDVTSSSITITDPSAVVNHLTINLTLNHTNDADLIITLIGPDGTSVVLSNKEGGSGQGFINTTFDDLAGTALSAGTAPFTGRFIPDDALGAFNGKTAAGKWTLTIEDTATGNTGTLVNWSMSYRASNSDNLTLNGTTSSINVEFDRDMDPSTFTQASILRMIGPAGLITGPFTISGDPFGTDPDPANPRTFRIGFPTQELSGTYVLTLAASIRAKEKTPGMHDGDLLDTQLNAGLQNLRGQSSTSAPVTYKNTTAAPVGSASSAGKVTTSVITINDNYLINGATLSLNMTYPSDPDLQAILIAPDGTQITLFSGLTKPGANFTNTVFDDSAATLISSGSPAFFGSFVPQQPLNTLINKNVNGDWTLQITDTSSGSTGQLNSWSLTFQKPTPSAGLTGSVAEQASVGFRIFTMDPTNPLSHSEWTAVGGASIADTGGPNGVSGRIGGIAVDPSDASGNTVFIAGASGGIWKTTNFLTTDSKGPTYIPLTDFGPTFGINIGGIAVFGRNNDTTQSIVFGATGEGDTGSAGAGFIRSTDGGATWNLLDSTTNVDASGNLLPINSPSRDHKFVGTSAFKILVDPKPTPSGDVIVYAALSGPNGGIWRSLDTGNHWTLMRAGQADDIAFDPNSGTFNAFSNPTGNLQTIFAAFRGDGVYMSPNRGQLWNQMLGNVGDPTTQDVTNLINNIFPPNTAVKVGTPNDTPTGNKGRIVLAKPALFPSSVANYQILNSQYAGWLYAGVANPDGSLNGLYLTKDFGQNWTQVRIPNAGSPLIATPSNDIGNPDLQLLGGVGGFKAQGNYDISLAVDPQNPAVVYFGGTIDGPPTAFIRIDTTFVHDAQAFYEDTASSTNTFGLNNINDSVVLKDWINTAPATNFFPNALQNGYVNLLRDPNNPFLTNATVDVVYADSFTNNGAGASWLPFDIDGTDHHRIWTMVDPATGLTRIIVGDDQGVYTVLDNGGKQVTGNFAGTTVPDASRNGNLQITQFYYGAAQPNNLAAQVSGALFYAMAQDNGFPQASADVLTTGNIGWSYPSNAGEGDGTGVATDQTGSGTLYQYKWPCCGGGLTHTDFFQVNGLGRTFGLIQQSNPGNTPDPQWPFLGGVNFAVNPVNGDQLIISSTAGRVFGTIDQGRHWSVIGDPSALDGNQAFALAYGAPGPAGQGGNDATNFLLYVGTTGGHVFATFNGGGANGNNWTDISAGLDGSAVNAIVTNPLRGSHEAYAVTSTGVFHMVDSSVANPTWVRISGTGNGAVFNITHNSFGNSNFSEKQLRSLNAIQADWRYVIPNSSGGGTHPVLYVGGDGGVYRSLDNGASWTAFPDTAIDGASVQGGYLPNVSVTDLDMSIGNVDPTTGMTTVANSPDVLLATTYGRSSFAIRLAPLVLPGTFAMDAADDLGFSNSDGNTSVTTPHFKGTSEASSFGNSVHITLFATDITDPNNPIDLGAVGTGLTDATGNFDIPVSLSSGLHTYTLTAQATDDAGTVGPLVSSAIKYPNGITIDTSQPTVTQVTSTVPASSQFNTGATVPVVLVFNEPVFVDTTKGTPTLALNDGGTATYVSGSGTMNLVFNYVVGAGQNTSDLDYNVNGLTIASGAIVNAAGGNAINSLGSASDFLGPRNIVIDTIAPTVTAVDTSTQGNRAYGIGSTITITVAFSETVVVTGQPKITLNSGGQATYTSGSNSSVLTFTYTVGANQNSSDLDYASANALSGGTIRDLATNAAVLTLPALGTSALKASNIVIDTGTPGKPTMTTASDTGTSHTDGITNNNHPTFTGLSSNDGGGIVQLVVLDPANNNAVLGSPIAFGSADPTGFYSITVPSTLADGAYRIAARSATGAISSGFQDIVVDTHGPDFFVRTINAQTATAFTGAIAHLNSDPNPPVSSPFSTVTITYGDGSPATTLAAPANGGDININHAWANAGTYFPQVTITDVAGNSTSFGDTANVTDTIDLGPAAQPTLNSQIINSGQNQRSHVDTIDFSFNNDVAFPDVTLAGLTLLHNGGDVVSLAGATLNYDINTGVGHLDLRSVTLPDGDYQLQINVGTTVPDFINFFKLTGDVNGDGVVNQKDLTIVTNAQNTSGALLEADADGNGVVNATDRLLVKSHLNHRIAQATTKTVKLNANGKVSPAAIRFGRVRAGSTVMAVDLVVKNNFGKAIQFSRAAIAGDSNAFHFGLPGKLWTASSSDLINIAAGGSVTVRIYLTPNNDGAATAKLTARYSDNGFISYGNAIASMNATIFG